MRPGFVFERNRYRVKGADGLERRPLSQRSGLAATVWTSESSDLIAVARWHLVDSADIGSGAVSAFACVKYLTEGMFLQFTGKLERIADVLTRIYRVLLGMPFDENALERLFRRCMIALVNGCPEGIEADPLPCDFWPGIYRSMALSSFTSKTFVPAQLVASLYIDVWEKLEPPAGQWVKQRFVSRETQIYDDALAVKLTVGPGVFVPDPVVVDLWGSAYLEPHSVLAADLRGARVIEPCTGSGVLGIAAALAGAASVISSDLDIDSVQCARANVEALEFSNLVRLVLADGIPRGETAEVIVVNPPWYTDELDTVRRMEAHYRRCLRDPGRRLLRRLLAEARDATGSEGVVYVFLGTDSPLGNSEESTSSVSPDSLEGWAITRWWRGAGGVHLWRLTRTSD